MPARRSAVLVLVLAGALLTGCGLGGGGDDGDGPSAPTAAELREQRAAYVRDADAVCRTARDAVRTAQPRSFESLEAAARRTERVAAAAAERLNALRARLGEAATTQIEAFDDGLDTVLARAEAVAEAAAARDAGATRSGAAALREASGELFEAAQAAGLQECGRGGNQAADAVRFAVYGEELSTVLADVLAQVERLEDGGGSSDGLDELRESLSRGNRVLRSLQRRLGRLAPPEDTREAHRRLQRRLTRLVGTTEELQAALEAGPGSLTPGQAADLDRRVQRALELAESAERALRGALGGDDAPPGGPGPPDPGPEPESQPPDDGLRVD